MSLVYIAQFRYGAANLATFEVERETGKTVRVLTGSRINIIGWVPGTIVFLKNSGYVFHTLSEALVCLRDKLSEHVAVLYDKQQSASAQHADIIKMLEEETK